MSEHSTHHSGTHHGGLSPYLSPIAVWALAVGTSVGWGSMVVTCSTYLAQAGPAGSILGILIGAAVMIVISRNLSFLMGHHPGAGGIYTVTRDIFGYDRAFLISWFASLTYMAMFWANATSLPLFARLFFGDHDPFCFGYLYTVFGNEVYLGEVLLTVAAIALVALLCVWSRQATAHVMTALVILFTLGISVCFFIAFFSRGGGTVFDPAFVPDEDSTGQILLIAFISPWAFVGFENVSHSSEEFNFSRKKTFGILLIAVVTTTLLYIFVTLLSVSAYPPEYANWLDYISHLNEETGIRALPAFYAAHRYLGNAGTGILYASLFALIITSLIGNIRALSRLFYALAKDKILPHSLAVTNRRKIPARAILLLAGVSCVVPFLGRTAIGWIVDVTTLGATLLYGFISAAAYKLAKHKRKNEVRLTGGLGFLLMLVFGAYLLLPDLFQNEALATETYFLFIVWSVLGMLYFSFIIHKDQARRYGKAIIVWIVLIALVVFMAMVWTARVEGAVAQDTVARIRDYYDGTASAEVLAMSEDEFQAQVLQNVHNTNSVTTAVVLGLFALAVGVMLGNHFSAKKWEKKAVAERDVAREAAYRDPLTGVKSKNAYVEAEREIDHAIRHGTSAPFAVVVGDVNGLKFVNDTRGHAAGDQLIREASSLICGYFKHSPVFRTGGDEFVILPEGQDLEARHEILKELNAVMESHIATGEVVVSLGMADFVPAEDERFHDVFSHADKAMYERKLALKQMGAATRD